MRAAVWHGYKDIRIEEIVKPTPSKGNVLVKVAWGGICGTDRHEYVGPNFIPTTKPHRLTGKVAPLVMGHEFSGVISELGEGVAGWQVGDRVTANGTLCCNECEMCKSGRYNICERLGFLGVSRDGAFAEFVEVESQRLFKLPDNLTLRDATIAEPIACGIHATKLLGDISGRDVLVIGPGIIGLGCFFAAKFAGAGRIIVAGIGEQRAKLVEGYGGVYVDTSKQQLEQEMKAVFGQGLADIVYECVGSQGSLDSSISALKPSGKLMVMGVFERPPVFKMNDFQEGERKLFTSQAHVDEIAAALELFSQGKIVAEDLITREVTLDSLVEEGFEELIKNGSEHIKIIIKID